MQAGKKDKRKQNVAKRPTIRDIARECGVSLSTVSLVLNNNPRISEATRQNVLRAVEQLGYHPDIHARGLAARYTRVISVVLPPHSHVFSDMYFGEIISGIYDYAQEIGYKLLLDVANDRFIHEREYLNLLRGRRADGILYVASSVGDHHLLDFLQEPYPFILVNNFFPQTHLNYVMADYETSARLAANYLYNLGHRQVGLIRGKLVQTGDLFHEVFTRSWRELGGAKVPVVAGDFGEESGGTGARALLKQHPGLTAIMAGNDRMAAGAIRAVESMGRSVPRDISVMGMDDAPIAEQTRPALTTVHHDIHHIGRTCARRLVELSQGTLSECRDTLPVELVVRGSTAPPPS